MKGADMPKTINKTQPIRFRIEKYQEIKDLATELSEERGSNVYMTDAVSEAVKFFKENRPKPGSK